jgi:hypothetical protein
MNGGGAATLPTTTEGCGMRNGAAAVACRGCCVAAAVGAIGNDAEASGTAAVGSSLDETMKDDIGTAAGGWKGRAPWSKGDEDVRGGGGGGELPPVAAAAGAMVPLRGGSAG